MNNTVVTAAIRSRYELPHGTYLKSHSIGCLLRAARPALDEHYFTPWANAGGDTWSVWLRGIDRFRDELGQLLNAPASEFCPQANVSSGLAKFLGALPPSHSVRKVLMHASAFPSLGFAVHAMAPLGFEPLLIDEDLPPDDPYVWERHIASDVVAILITHVHSNTGIRSPVGDLAALARQHDLISIVDIAQSVGIVPIDLADWQADVVLGSCVKWLCGGPGAGYLWVRSDLLGMLQPVDVGWFSHEDPFEWDIRDFRYAPDALRFWGGTPAVAPYVVAAEAIANARDIGVGAMRAHNLELLGQLHEGLAGSGVQCTPPERSGGTACLRFDAATTDRIEKALSADNCRFDRRGATLRLSPHVYNTPSELHDAAAIIRSALD